MEEAAHVYTTSAIKGKNKNENSPGYDMAAREDGKNMRLGLRRTGFGCGVATSSWVDLGQ